MEKIQYQLKELSSLGALAGLLQISVETLISIAEIKDSLYRQNPPEVKKSGKIRITYTVDDRLKSIQTAIKNKIFNNTTFPRYLQGAIRDKSNPRTYLSNAKIHAGARIIISEDASNYFDSISESNVVEMWKYLFGFNIEVAEILAKLSTNNGYVRQGGVIGSYIANSIFWDLEPQLAHELSEKGITYTRYIDDIVMSSNKQIPKHELKSIISSVYGMFAKKGIKPNREKHEVMTGKGRMSVHNLTVNTCRPTMTKAKRRQIRMTVFNLEKAAKISSCFGSEYQSLHLSASGKVREMYKFHPTEGKRLQGKLDLIRPK